MAEKENIIDFCNAVEAACVNLRKKLGDTTAPTANGKDHQWSWDPTKIKWDPMTGTKGPYEKATDQSNIDFQKLTVDLTEHKGKLNRDGKFYWQFQNGDVGRKGP